MVSWKIYNVIAWIILGGTTLAFSIIDSTWPRPWFLFFGIGMAITILYLQTADRSGDISQGGDILIIAAGLTAGFLLRWSEFATVLVSGSDMIAHFDGRAGYIIEHGHTIPIPSEGLRMYAHTPLRHIIIATNKMITGLWLFDVRFISIVISTTLPLLVYILARSIDGQRTGLYALLLTVSFPLFLRTGALFDTESLAIPLFVLILFFLLRSLIYESRRNRLLLGGLAIASSWIHFLYPMIMLATIGGAVIVLYIMNFFNKEGISNSFAIRPMYIPVIGVMAAGLLHFSRLILTDAGIAMFVGKASHGSFSMPNSLFSLLVPTGGAVGRATSTGGNLFNKIGNFVPIMIFVFLVASGGIFILYSIIFRESRVDPSQRQRYVFLVVVGVVLFPLTIIMLTLFTTEGSDRLGFRIYYFISLVGLPYAGIALHRILGHTSDFRIGPKQLSFLSANQALLLVSILIVLSYSILAPMSTFGNNVDPRFGGNSQRITYSDYVQLSALDKVLSGHDPILDIRLSRIQLNNAPSQISPLGDKTDRDLYIVSRTDRECGSSDTTWVSDTFKLCQKRTI